MNEEAAQASMPRTRALLYVWLATYALGMLGAWIIQAQWWLVTVGILALPPALALVSAPVIAWFAAAHAVQTTILAGAYLGDSPAWWFQWNLAMAVLAWLALWAWLERHPGVAGLLSFATFFAAWAFVYSGYLAALGLGIAGLLSARRRWSETLTPIEG